MVEESDATREGDDGAEVRTDDHGDTGTSLSIFFPAVTAKTIVLTQVLLATTVRGNRTDTQAARPLDA